MQETFMNFNNEMWVATLNDWIRTITSKKLGCSWKGKRLVDVLYQEHLIQLSAWTKAQCASSGTLITALTLNG